MSLTEKQIAKLNLVFARSDEYSYIVKPAEPDSGVVTIVRDRGFYCECRDYYQFNLISELGAQIEVLERSPDVIYFSDPNAWYTINYTIDGPVSCCNPVELLSINTAGNVARPAIDVYGNIANLTKSSGCVLVPGQANNIVVKNVQRNLRVVLSIKHVQPKWKVSPWAVSDPGGGFCLNGIQVYSTRLQGTTAVRTVAPEFQCIADDMRQRYLSYVNLSCYSCENRLYDAITDFKVLSTNYISIVNFASSKEKIPYDVSFSGTDPTKENCPDTDYLPPCNYTYYMILGAITTAPGDDIFVGMLRQNSKGYLQFQSLRQTPIYCRISVELKVSYGYIDDNTKLLCEGDNAPTLIFNNDSAEGRPFFVLGNDLKPNGDTTISRYYSPTIRYQMNNNIIELDPLNVMRVSLNNGLYKQKDGFCFSTSPFGANEDIWRISEPESISPGSHVKIELLG